MVGVSGLSLWFARCIRRNALNDAAYLVGLPLCTKCCYDLRGSPVGKPCPECGTGWPYPLDGVAASDFARRRLVKLQRKPAGGADASRQGALLRARQWFSCRMIPEAAASARAGLFEHCLALAESRGFVRMCHVGWRRMGGSLFLVGLWGGMAITQMEAFPVPLSAVWLQRLVDVVWYAGLFFVGLLGYRIVGRPTWHAAAYAIGLPLCTKCCYDLRGSPIGKPCPECGTAWPDPPEGVPAYTGESSRVERDVTH